ncbi:glycosyltransferase family 1 protein [Flavobacterium sp. MK4S-17]|uniref:glycosyltransferase family 4 protein n=1 Tax=Flavobacterium sp. MK4S-17 TaxID=2543737 RepID=UPI00135814F8|nr:glycosyltransferase family 1 protein [Flavobacterium sp. MK4S-17]
MKTIFLEAHHVKNLYFGFGQFNYNLLKSLSKIENPEFEFVVHAKNISFLKEQFGSYFSYKKYYSLRRYPALRIRKEYSLWHALNQNTKIEPYGSNVPYLLTVHDHPNIKDTENYRQLPEHKIFQEKLSRSTAITYISEYTKLSTQKFYDVPNVPQFVIYNGNPITDITLAENFTPNFVPKRPFLFTIGVIQPRKNFNQLIKMMEFLPEFDLVISGANNTGAGEELKKLINHSGLQERITLTGQVNEAEKQYYYKHCTAFVFPSRREGFGLPVIEAMRFGKPVFLSDKTCLPEIGGDAASYWYNYEPEYMAGVLKEGLENHYNNEPVMVEKLIARSKHFSWDKAALEYYDVYKQLLK